VWPVLSQFSRTSELKPVKLCHVGLLAAICSYFTTKSEAGFSSLSFLVILCSTNLFTALLMNSCHSTTLSELRTAIAHVPGDFAQLSVNIQWETDRKDCM